MPERGGSSGAPPMPAETLMQTANAALELNAVLLARVAALEVAVYDLVNMERVQTPDMSGKRRTYAYMRNGAVLADCLDRARALLPYDMAPTDPVHGGKQST